MWYYNKRSLIIPVYFINYFIKGEVILEKGPEDVNKVDWAAWVPEEKAVIVYIRVKNEIVLIHKKTGLGKGKINAPGGRIEKGETPAGAAVRECMEEIGVVPLNLIHTGELSFIFMDGYSLFGYVFFADGYEGKLESSREADPFMCSIDSIPYGSMWEDDILWLPHAIDGKFIRGQFIFDSDRMVSHNLFIDELKF